MSGLTQLKIDIKSNANSEHASNMRWFFKTGKGEYGEGDKFLGLKLPVQRKIAKKYTILELGELQKLLDSNTHEERLIALLILVGKYFKADENEKKQIFNFYMKNSKNVNNWDLVDLSAPKIAGMYLFGKDCKILFKFARSKNLWERRISIISTLAFIKQSRFDITLKISDILLNDKHDLIHKAVGWMLREVGKENLKVLEKFLKSRYNRMPRTMLRYSIEKFPEQKRQKYLKGKI